MSEAREPGATYPDAVWASCICDGDVAAYTAAFREYYLPVVQFLERYLPSDGAEDIVQDVFVRLWEDRHEMGGVRSLRAYLFATARNRALNVLKHGDVVRRHVNDTGRLLAEEAELSPEPQADELLIASELSGAAEARAALLSPRLREVYHLSRHEGLTAAEIAEVLGTSVQTVYTQLTKVTQALYPVLKQWLGE